MNSIIWMDPVEEYTIYTVNSDGNREWCASTGSWEMALHYAKQYSQDLFNNEIGVMITKSVEVDYMFLSEKELEDDE